MTLSTDQHNCCMWLSVKAIIQKPNIFCARFPHNMQAFEDAPFGWSAAAGLASKTILLYSQCMQVKVNPRGASYNATISWRAIMRMFPSLRIREQATQKKRTYRCPYKKAHIGQLEKGNFPLRDDLTDRFDMTCLGHHAFRKIGGLLAWVCNVYKNAPDNVWL